MQVRTGPHRGVRCEPRPAPSRQTDKNSCASSSSSCAQFSLLSPAFQCPSTYKHTKSNPDQRHLVTSPVTSARPKNARTIGKAPTSECATELAQITPEIPPGTLLMTLRQALVLAHPRLTPISAASCRRWMFSSLTAHELHYASSAPCHSPSGDTECQTVCTARVELFREGS